MQVTTTDLTKLVAALNYPEFSTVESLLVKMMKSQTAAKAMLRLLYWTPKSVNNGWVYKSACDWDSELGLTPAQIKLIHRRNILENFGVSRKLKKANGAPTTHYFIDFEAFLSRVAHFIGHSLEQVRALLTGAKPAQPKEEPPHSISTPIEVPIEREQVTEAKAPPPSDPLVGKMSASKVWDETKANLEAHFGVMTYNAYIRKADFAGYDLAKRTLTLTVPNEIVRDMLQHRLYPVMKKLFNNIADVPSEIVVSVQPPHHD